jgi:cyclic beta-1,2-glucan synthetase
MLGLRRHGTTFEMDPCIPAAWPSFSIAWRFGGTRYEIDAANPMRHCRGVASASLDGVECDPRAIPLTDDGGTHRVSIVLGHRRRG